MAQGLIIGILFTFAPSYTPHYQAIEIALSK